MNGRGTLVTTEECLLSPVQARNAGLCKLELEEIFRRWLGVSKVLWLGRGIAGDDTHGHVDDIARFVNPTTLAVSVESNRARRQLRGPAGKPAAAGGGHRSGRPAPSGG